MTAIKTFQAPIKKKRKPAARRKVEKRAVRNKKKSRSPKRER